MSGHCQVYPIQPDLQHVPKLLNNHGPFSGSEHPASPHGGSPPTSPSGQSRVYFHPQTERISHPHDYVPASMPAPIAFPPPALSAPSPHPAGMTACRWRLSAERDTAGMPPPTHIHLPHRPTAPATPPVPDPGPSPPQTPQARNEQMYSQIPSATVIVNPLLAATSKCVPAGYVADSVPPSITTVQLPAMISMRSAAAVPK
jgi:hypothetical protein